MTYAHLTDAEIYIEIANRLGYIVLEDAPNWPGNIADAYQLEDSVPEEGRERYAEILAGVVEPNAVVFTDAIYTTPRSKMNAYQFCYALAHATPRQRCEAWLMWDDERRER